MKAFRLTLTAAMALALGALSQQSHAAAHAAKVIYAFGQVQASTDAGKARQLRKGDRVFPGETVATRRGRAQVQFTDGGFASLQPNTEYRIDDYNFSGKADGKERSFLSLVRGSVRLVTGIIGKTNRKSFRIKTKVATIGIRGTSGKVSHCDSNCGNVPEGTRLQGYGGVWDLVSGSFSGPVASGDAYVCDGTTCRQMKGGVAQREDVGFYAFEQDDYEQGQQVDDDGVLCDLGGNCGDIVVLTDQIGAGAFQGSPGDTEATDGLNVVLQGGSPVAFVTVDDEVEEPDVAILTVDVDALRSAVNGISDPEGLVQAYGNQILDQIDPHDLEHLRSDPASTAPEDFGLTSDGLLTKGRWVDGYVLEVDAFLDSISVYSEVFKLTGFQSEHFIYGQDPGVVPTSGEGIYNFTGGTYSTATDGSSIGMGATGGQLTYNFGTGMGALNMTVVHNFENPTMFDISGSIEADGSRTFSEQMVSAVSGEGSYYVQLDGFFAVPNGDSAPLAAGLGYAIEMYESLGYDIIGTAGFGLDFFGPAPSDITVKYALNYDNYPGMLPYSWANGDGTAFGATISTSPLSFTTAFGDTFDSGGATPVESGTVPSLEATWARFSASGTSFTSTMAPPAGINTGPMSGAQPPGDFVHTALTTNPTPDSVVSAMTGSMSYGGMSPVDVTMPTRFSPLGDGVQLGTLTEASFIANFTSGDMDSISFMGTFPDGTWSLTGGGPGVKLIDGWASLSGGATMPVGCGGPCFSVNGSTAYTFAGGNAEGIVFSYQGMAVGSSADAAWSGAGVVTKAPPP